MKRHAATMPNRAAHAAVPDVGDGGRVPQCPASGTAETRCPTNGMSASTL